MPKAKIREFPVWVNRHKDGLLDQSFIIISSRSVVKKEHLRVIQCAWQHIDDVIIQIDQIKLAK